MILRRLDLASDNPMLVAMKGRLDRALDLVEARLGEVPHLAGSEFTAADIMTVFSLTTMRIYCRSTSRRIPASSHTCSASVRATGIEGRCRKAIPI